jgi:hypothetical protein
MAVAAASKMSIAPILAVAGALGTAGFWKQSRDRGLTLKELQTAKLAEEAKVTELTVQLNKTRENLKVALEVQDRQDRLLAVETQLAKVAEGTPTADMMLGALIGGGVAVLATIASALR